MRTSWLLLLLVACGGDKDATDTDIPVEGDADADADSDADADADSDTDSDTDADTDADADTDTPGTPQAEVRAVHLSEDFGPIDVHIDDRATPTVTAIDPLDGTIWRSADIGVRNFDITETGLGVPGTLGEIDIDLIEDARYSIVLYGPDTAPELTFLPDDDRNIAQGDIRVRVFNALDGAPPVSFSEASFGVLATDLAYGDDAVIDIPRVAPVIEVDFDGTPGTDATYVFVDPGGQELVNFYLTWQGGPVVLGHSPLGIVDLQQPQ